MPTTTLIDIIKTGLWLLFGVLILISIGSLFGFLVYVANQGSIMKDFQVYTQTTCRLQETPNHVMTIQRPCKIDQQCLIFDFTCTHTFRLCEDQLYRVVYTEKYDRQGEALLEQLPDQLKNATKTTCYYDQTIPGRVLFTTPMNETQIGWYILSGNIVMFGILLLIISLVLLQARRA